jgi:hypothetical protein
MPEINEAIRKKLEKYHAPIGNLCKEVVTFAQTMPETAVKEHLDVLIRKAVKKEELRS